MIEKLDHIGIAVRDLDQAMKLYREAFGIEPSLVYESAYTKARIAFFNVGESRIELIQPTQPESVMAKFLEKRGEGIHHVSLKVKDVDASLGALEAKGVGLIDKKARKVRDSEKVAFLSPKSTNGVLMELIEGGAEIEGTAVRVPMVGKVVEVKKRVGDPVRKKEVIAILDSMKMKVPIFSTVEGVIRELNGVMGQVLNKGDVLAIIS